MAGYDDYYKTADLFGEPYPALLTFFKNHHPKGKLLDIGCGQGRDAIALARIGYAVTGVDLSKIGIEQMRYQSDLENLTITGLVQDIYAFDKYHAYDIVLLDSMFHFEKRGKQRETDLIRKIAKEIRNEALICICVQDTGSKVRIVKDTLRDTKLDFEIMNDSSLVYEYEDKESGHKSKTKYCMYIIKKK